MKTNLLSPYFLNNTFSQRFSEKIPSSTTSSPSLTSAQQLRQWAKRSLAKRDYRSAIAFLTQVINRHPDSALDYNNRGLIYFYQGQFNKANQDYNQAIGLNADLDSPYNNRANCLAALGRSQEAFADYETALDLNPLNMRTWLNFGITLREAGFHDQAIEKFDIALILSPILQGHFYAERGYTYYLRGDWNCAIADYRRAMDQLALMDPYRQKVACLLNHLIAPQSRAN